LKVRHRLADWVALRPVRDQLGLTRIDRCYTGGAPLGPDVFGFFHSIGVNLKQIYGQTEICGIASRRALYDAGHSVTSGCSWLAATLLSGLPSTVWALATGSVIFGLAAHHDLTTAQLGVWHFGGVHFLRQTYSLPGAAMMIGAALVIAVAAAWPASRRGDNPVGVAISGALGPLLVSSAYFFAAPPLAGVQSDDQLSAYAIAPLVPKYAGKAARKASTAIAIAAR